MRCKKINLMDAYPFLGEDGCMPVLNTYLPDNLSEMHRENQRRPAILICPGGGYGMCSQREAEPVALHYLHKGYNVFILWYSVAPHCFPQQIREVAAAVDLIHRNAESWNCDENHVAIMGFSAGGHLAAHYSTSFDCREVRSVFPESYPVAASILCYPVITADPAYTHMGSIENVSGHKPIMPEDVKRFSCELLVTEKTPPAYIWHTAEDPWVPVHNSFLYARALSEKNIPFELHVFLFGAHGLATCDEQTNDGEITERTAHNQSWIEESQQWLKLLWENHGLENVSSQ